MGLPEKDRGTPRELSGVNNSGSRSHAALAMEPKLMLFDEPTARSTRSSWAKCSTPFAASPAKA